MHKAISKMGLLAGLLCVACACAVSGCVLDQSQVLGIAPPAGPVTPIRDLKETAKPVVIAGKMVEKCPISGCWFKMTDGTGLIKVDTKNAGFVVMNIPLNTQVTVSGTMHKGDEPLLEAKGVRY
ncbi:MAG TPA: hypothetical protein VFW40_08145 [Capsulimonadaceae bacterium]|nr:hypothetical protein [Capsulimonadaceae bacterium]